MLCMSAVTSGQAACLCHVSVASPPVGLTTLATYLEVVWRCTSVVQLQQCDAHKLACSPLQVQQVASCTFCEKYDALTFFVLVLVCTSLSHAEYPAAVKSMYATVQESETT
jgi:hypothetical protein